MTEAGTLREISLDDRGGVSFAVFPPKTPEGDESSSRIRWLLWCSEPFCERRRQAVDVAVVGRPGDAAVGADEE
jgi:hypothetical protein